MPRVKAIVVSHDEAARQALRSTLLEAGDVDVVGEAGNAVDAVDRVTSLSPDVVLVDADLPHISGLETTRILKDRGFPGAVIVLSDDIQRVEAALQSGALGYLNKNCSAEELLGVIRQVLEGEFAFGADVMGTREGMMIALRYITGEAAEPAQPVASTASAREDDEAEEPVAERDKEVTSDVDMVISAPVDTASVLKLYQWLQGVASADVNEVVGSWTGDTVVKVTLRRPIPLLRMLAELPEVLEVSEEPYSEAVDTPSRQAFLEELSRGRTPPTRIRVALRPE